MSAANGGAGRPDSPRLFWATIAGAALVLSLAYGLSLLIGVRIAPILPRTPGEAATGIAFGAAATLPLLVLLAFFMRTGFAPLRRFRESQLAFLRELGFELTPFRIIAIGVAAGVSEELLFRGVLQAALDARTSTIFAILAPNVLFGLLHARTALYAFIAFALGVYLGAIFAFSGGLAAPVATHAFYDIGALWIARRAIGAQREEVKTAQFPNG